MTSKCKIIIVDDHELFRTGVIMTLKKVETIVIVGEASNGKELLKILPENTPDVILMDIKMPEMDGIETTKEVLKKYPEIKIIALSMFGDELYLENMLLAGAQGFLLKSVDSKELKNAIQSIANGEQYFSQEFIPYFTRKYISGNKPKKQNDAQLTKREIEILQLIGNGQSNQEIADKLHISIRTVTNHRANLYAKTGSKNTANLLSYALKNKLVTM